MQHGASRGLIGCCSRDPVLHCSPTHTRIIISTIIIISIIIIITIIMQHFVVGLLGLLFRFMQTRLTASKHFCVSQVYFTMCS